MYDALATTLTMDRETAFFSVVWPSVADTHPRITELTAYAPEANRKQEIYLAATFIVAHDMMNPTSAAPMQIVMCQVRSFRFPEDRATAKPTNAETRYGGQVNTKVIVSLKPRLPTTCFKPLTSSARRRDSPSLQRYTYSRKEVVERTGTEVHVLHEREEIKTRITNSLHEASLCTFVLFCADSIALDTIMGQLPLLRAQPPGGEREVWKQENSNGRNTESDSAFDDEQPVLWKVVSITRITAQRIEGSYPACQAMRSVQCSECGCCNEA